MRKYRLVAKKGEGTFSEVLKAQNVKDGRYHAIKCMKNRFESIDQVNNLREIQALRRLSPHEHVITLEEVLYDQPTGRLALVFELMDANLYELIRGRRHFLNPQLIKSYMYQLMKSLDHMHKKGIFHRDIKPENILIESGTMEIGKGLKLADFGSCRGIYSKQPYTEYISTRWYRAPECLLTDGYYGPEMDLWGAGCVMFEITSLYPLFPGSNESDQIHRIHKILGTPSPDMLAKFKSKGSSHISFDFPDMKPVGIGSLIPHAPPDAIDLMVKLLKYDGGERITAREAMKHPYLKEMREMDMKRVDGNNVIASSSPISSSSSTMKSSAVDTLTSKKLASSSSVNHHDATKSLPTIDASSSMMHHSKSSSLSTTNNHHIMMKDAISSSSSSLISSSLLPPIHVNPNAANANHQKLLSGRQAPVASSSSQVNNNSKKKKKAKNNANVNSNTLSSTGASNLASSQNADHVMKTYGLRNHPPVVEAVLKQYNANASTSDTKTSSYTSTNRYSIPKKN